MQSVIVRWHFVAIGQSFEEALTMRMAKWSKRYRYESIGKEQKVFDIWYSVSRCNHLECDCMV